MNLYSIWAPKQDVEVSSAVQESYETINTIKQTLIKHQEIFDARINPSRTLLESQLESTTEDILGSHGNLQVS